MSRNFTPTFVYQRRRLSNNFVAIEPPNGIKPSNGFQPAISSEVPSLTAQQNVVCFSEREAENERSSPIMGPVECNTVATVSIDTSDRFSNAFNANDNCSSSKSNLELSSASLKFESDDAGECSSSGALIDEKETSSRDICISILRSQGLLNWIRQNRDFTEKSSENYCSKSCRVCGRVESTLNMLLCDNCEDAFHVSCYKPRVTVLPVGEWLCGSCLKKKHKMLKDKSAGNSINISNEIVTNRCLASEGELGSLEFMFRDTEPYMSNVRIGDEFQASVPDCSGPIDEECNLIGDSLELGASDHVNIQGRDCIKPLKLSSIGNWLQCRGIVEGIGEGVDGTICAKWRSDEEPIAFKKMHDFSTVDGFVEITENLADMIKFIANEPSVGLFYIQQHTQNASPNILNLKNNIVEKSHETASHAQDLEDSITVLRSMKECGFPIADEMIKDIKKSLSVVSTKQPKRGLIYNSSTGVLGRTSSWSPATWGQSSLYTRQDGGKRSGYLSGIFKSSAKQTADDFKRPQVECKEVNLDPTVASTSECSLTSELQEESQLSKSSSHQQQLLSLYEENYDEFKANREAKLEEWLGTGNEEEAAVETLDRGALAR